MRIKINTTWPYILGKFGILGKIKKILIIKSFSFIEYDIDEHAVNTYNLMQSNEERIISYDNIINILLKSNLIIKNENEYFIKDCYNKLSKLVLEIEN